ncbi:hypothetical protein A1O3_06649 [Capronia epimyces CBS 606.96]|uniref:RTA1 domain protein n=1 Tax=Capronia epimyces CBS 606.96 TaxID=1182542 RepID=W9YKR8_9EURO|nr:uncharacterized protein A1O3_06649 [Capronia epimyces CBS 606.96]EXJ82834.1 hypothetical protein A1O3_06649 [Capronia epimyces CBS 606.96]
MPSIVCHAGPDENWAYCPSLGAAVLFTVLFGLTTGAHIIQAVVYRKRFAMVLIMGGLWEVGGYIVRLLSIEHQRSDTLYTVQLLLILLAPLWINAYIYMLLGRMVHFFLEPDRVLRIPARFITRVFVLFDITAFVIQATGGSMTEPGTSAQTQENGLHIYTAGVGVQLFFLLIFVVLAVGFQRTLRLRRGGGGGGNACDGAGGDGGGNSAAGGVAGATDSGSGQHFDLEFQAPSQAQAQTQTQSQTHLYSPIPEPLPDPRLAVPLLRVLYSVMGLIIFRNIYRLVEFGTGANSPTVKHEWFAYVFDAVPMFFAFVIINLAYPGKILQGPRSDFSEQTKERKRARREKKAAKKAEQREKDMKKMAENGAAY